MPKFYCDYCDIHLTHDSRRVRRDHNSGWKHKMHIQNYYADLPVNKVQSIINNITKAYVYAGLGGFPELPTPGQKNKPQAPRMQGFPPGFIQPPPGMLPMPGMIPPPGFPGMVGPNGMMMPPPGFPGMTIGPNGMMMPPPGFPGMPAGPNGMMMPPPPPKKI